MTNKMDIQTMIQTLQHFWADKGCMLMQAYDTEKGAGTMSRIPSCAPSGRNLGPRRMSNRRAGRQTGATGKTRTGCTNTTSFKS